MKKVPGLYQRRNIWWYAKQVNRTRRFFSLQTTDLAVALERVAQLTDSPLLPTKDTVAALTDQFIRTKVALNEYTPASVDSKSATLKKFGRFCQLPVAQVSTKTVQAFHDAQIAAGLSPDTAKSYVGVLRAFFRWAIEKRLRVGNPATSVRAVRTEPKARRDFCRPELVGKLIAEAPNDELRFIIYCGFHAGLRKQEIIESKAEWFDLEAGIIHLRKHAGISFKDREERSLPMSGQFRAFLRTYGTPSPYMIRPAKVKGRSLYRFDFERPFKDYMAAQGCPWVTPHVMRHTFASLLASKGENIFHIAAWLGDDVRVVQKHYAKLLPVTRDIGRAFCA